MKGITIEKGSLEVHTDEVFKVKFSNKKSKFIIKPKVKLSLENSIKRANEKLIINGRNIL